MLNTRFHKWGENTVQVCFLPLNLSFRLGFVEFITDKFDWEYVLPIYWKTATLD